jgi:non-specific serine/threonine protein kinase
VFCLEGDVWTITYDGRTVRFRDMRGLHYLAQLLRAPGRQFHASELVGTPGESTQAKAVAGEVPVVMGLGDAGPALDARAGAAYRRRLADLREELEEAERLNDLGRAVRAREEMESLSEQLAAAARGGRTASHAERARLTVTKGIKAALTRIAERHPPLGAHIAATVRRGYFCAYLPDPRHPISWVV